MKRLDELGISPAPWKIGKERFEGIVGDIFASNSELVTYDAVMTSADARLIAAAPDLYDKAYEVADNLLVHLAMPSQTISINRAEVAAMVKDLLAALAKASGESEVEK